MGHGDRHHSDHVAVSEMRSRLENVSINGRIVIGEGERDKAPMLHIGECVGQGGSEFPDIDIAVDPLEGTNLCAIGAPGAVTVLAASEQCGLLQPPDIYPDFDSLQLSEGQKSTITRGVSLFLGVSRAI